MRLAKGHESWQVDVEQVQLSVPSKELAVRPEKQASVEDLLRFRPLADATGDKRYAAICRQLTHSLAGRAWNRFGL